jgi:glycogen operon protein
VLAGDEFGRTQGGNNNAYCQDDEISWVDWNITDAGRALTRFVQMLTGLRHRYPILRRGRFMTGAYNEALGLRDVTWINATGEEMRDEDWQDGNLRCFGMLMDGRAQATGIRRHASDATMLMVPNAYHDLVGFTLPECAGGTAWALVFDTNIPEDGREQRFGIGDAYDITGRSLVLFQLVDGAGQHPPAKKA